MNERIKRVRKEFGLSQQVFADKIGIGNTSVSKIELGENNPSEQTLRAICREYHVSYIWLTTGDGEMFEESNLALYDKIDEIMQGEDEFHKQLIKSIIDLDDETIQKIKKVIVDLYESQIKKD